MYLCIDLLRLDESSAYAGKKQIADHLNVNVGTISKAIREKQIIKNCYIVSNIDVVKTNNKGRKLF